MVKIFLSLRFYVNTNLAELESQITLFEALNFDFYVFLHFFDADIYQISKIQST